MVSGLWLAFFDSLGSGFEEVARELAHLVEEAFEFSLFCDGAWNFHQVASLAGSVYDACLRLCQADPRIPCAEDVNGTYKTDLYVEYSGHWTPLAPMSYTTID